MPFPDAITAFQGRQLPCEAAPAGYAALIAAYGLQGALPRTLSAISLRHRKSISDGWRIMTPRHAPPATLEGHLTFALKYEGLDLALLAGLFGVLDPAAIESMVRAKPTGAYTRRIWFLYEWLTGRELDLPPLRRGSYVDALDARLQYPGAAVNSRRHRVRNNLPGTPDFCPLVFRTPELERLNVPALSARAADILCAAPPDLRPMIALILDQGEGLQSYRRSKTSFPEPLAAAAERFFESTLCTLDTVTTAACLGFGVARACHVQDPADPCHRQMIQDVLLRRGFGVPGVTLPVSMVSLKRKDDYRRLLTAGRGALFDATPHAVFLHECLKTTVEKALPDAAQAIPHFLAFMLETTVRALCSERLSALLFEQMRKHGGTLPRPLLARRRCLLSASQIEEIETLFRETRPAQK
ncbi:MAG: hypothetical protein DCC64_15825 [Planctomycetota bacterium]|nr:MAG: hypothetical protein DCC64_15825 [Planctomycetota bacterium]